MYHCIETAVEICLFAHRPNVTIFKHTESGNDCTRTLSDCKIYRDVSVMIALQHQL